MRYSEPAEPFSDIRQLRHKKKYRKVLQGELKVKLRDIGRSQELPGFNEQVISTKHSQNIAEILSSMRNTKNRFEFSPLNRKKRHGSKVKTMPSLDESQKLRPLVVQRIRPLFELLEQTSKRVKREQRGQSVGVPVSQSQEVSKVIHSLPRKRSTIDKLRPISIPMSLKKVNSPLHHHPVIRLPVSQPSKSPKPSPVPESPKQRISAWDSPQLDPIQNLIH